MREGHPATPHIAECACGCGLDARDTSSLLCHPQDTSPAVLWVQLPLSIGLTLMDAEDLGKPLTSLILASTQPFHAL